VDRAPKPDFAYPRDIHITTMTRYKTDYPFPVAFAPQHMGNVLAEWLGKQGARQCHIAETEKYAHVTFFFNGGVEKQFAGEERDLIPSPKVATYDLDPPMSAAGVADKLCERIGQGAFEFIMNNFAPPDMVGHTGVYKATIEAVAATDKAIGQVYEKCKQEGYILFITADHGHVSFFVLLFFLLRLKYDTVTNLMGKNSNAEEMLTEEGTPKTAHTTNKVPFVMANAPHGWSLKKQDGVLGDVAPTVLDAMGIDQPSEMSGHSLLVKA
jgi:2,3-bisphosphoglycerate-independent phosphoglycerate mutase